MKKRGVSSAPAFLFLVFILLCVLFLGFFQSSCLLISFLLICFGSYICIPVLLGIVCPVRTVLHTLNPSISGPQCFNPLPNLYSCDDTVPVLSHTLVVLRSTGQHHLQFSGRWHRCSGVFIAACLASLCFSFSPGINFCQHKCILLKFLKRKSVLYALFLFVGSSLTSGVKTSLPVGFLNDTGFLLAHRKYQPLLAYHVIY